MKVVCFSIKHNILIGYDGMLSGKVYSDFVESFFHASYSLSIVARNFREF